MGLFSSTPKNYASIVAPLKQIETDLTEYMANQENNISDLETQKAEIEAKISDSQMEIAKSQGTVVKISELLSFDLDEDGIADVDELPPEPEEPGTTE